MELIKLFQDIISEWTVIADAPFSFITAAIAVSLLAYFASRFRYHRTVDAQKAEIASHKATIDNLRERLVLKTEQSQTYMDKAAKWDQKAAEVVAYDGVQLQQRTLDLVRNLRNFTSRANTINNKHIFHPHTPKQSEEEASAEFWRRNLEMSNETERQKAEYDERFKVDAILLRDELRSRLPDYKPENAHHFMYEHPTNYHGYTMVADDLERMAKLLTSPALLSR